jgi:hypothetical protein
MENKDAQPGRLDLALSACLYSCGFDVLAQLSDGIFERGARVVDLIHNEHVFANQVGHLERGEVEPLRPGDLGPRRLHRGRSRGGQGLVERETDGLDGDVGTTGLLEKGPDRSDVSRAVGIG